MTRMSVAAIVSAALLSSNVYGVEYVKMSSWLFFGVNKNGNPMYLNTEVAKFAEGVYGATIRTKITNNPNELPQGTKHLDTQVMMYCKSRTMQRFMNYSKDANEKLISQFGADGKVTKAQEGSFDMLMVEMICKSPKRTSNE